MTNKVTSKKKCNHAIGYTESNGYDGDMITEFVYLDSLDLEKANELKSAKGSLFNFCHNCGKKLEGLLDKKVEELTVIKNKREEDKKIMRDKADVLFQIEVTEVSLQTKLNQLPDEGSFVIIFDPTQNSNGKDVVMAGGKETILRNCVNYNRYWRSPDTLTVKTVYKTFSQEVFASTLEKNGWKPSGSKSFEKQESNKMKQLILDNDGIIYVIEKTTDSDGEVSSNYDRFTINRLAEYLKVEIPLETFDLK